MVDVCVTAPALARGGDVPGSVALRPGGAAANVAVWVRAAGAGARVVARRGADLAGELLAAALTQRGVEVHAPAASQPTGAMLVVWEAGERSFVADPALAAGALARRVPVAVVKLGPAGVLVAAGEELHALDAAQAEAVDPTGAGDALAAGYLVARAGGADPVEAARAGVLLAARAVACEGAWPGSAPLDH